LIRCLQSIANNPPQCEYEIIVIDDASPDSLKGNDIAWPRVRVLRNTHNLGFAASNNRGIGESAGEFILLLNNDTEVLPGALDSLVSVLAKNPSVGAVGPKILNADGSFQVQCKRGMLSPLSGIAYSVGLDKRFPNVRPLSEYLLRWVDPDNESEVKALSGACILLRRAAVSVVGGMDESFGMYGEDLDLCYRLGTNAWKVSFVPTARIIHFGGKGGSAVSSYRNLYLYHRALWILFCRYPQTRFFWAYGWFVWLAIGVRFAVCSVSNFTRGEKRVGTQKTG
jgi:hypothetical protein